MKYLGVDYLYNLDEKKITISQFTNREIECVLLFSKEIHSVEIAISRDVLFRELKVPFNEKVYDIFDITSNVNYSIENDDVRITNKSFVDTFVSELAESLYHIEKNLIGTILLQLEKEKNDLRKILSYKIPCSGVISRPAASTSCRSFFITSAVIHLRSTLTVRTRLRLRTMS
ncbi:MAG: hypothetical protein SPG67_11005, partial [Sodaliphilus sp.]|nr:hypothetical protein [Sodaliphilus sp.]